MSIKVFLRKVLDELYPDVACYSCGAERSEWKGKLCPACRAQLEAIKDNPSFIEGRAYYACCRYDGLARKLVLQAKDSGKSYLTQIMAEYMADAVRTYDLTFDVIAYVPSSSKKRAFRGYDHMKLVADFLSEMTQKPVLKGLKRIKEWADQTDVAEEKRADNVKNSFRYDGQSLAGKRVLVIDDVVSTGATTREVASAIEQAKPDEILYLTFTK